MPAINLEMRQAGYDECAAADAGKEPFILYTETGAEEASWAVLTNGLVGPGPYGDPAQPGRLRQVGGLNDGTAAARIELDRTWIDNVDLEEYLGPPAGGQYQGDRIFKDAAGNDPVGRAATTRLIEWITPGGEELQFGEAVLESPRYAVLPVLNYDDNRANITGDSWHAIMDMVPVCIQVTWFECKTPTTDCRFEPTCFDFAGAVDGLSIFFHPGEGSSPPCLQRTEGDPCNVPGTISAMGASAFVSDSS